MNKIEVLKAVMDDLKANNKLLVDSLSLAETMKLMNDQQSRDSNLRDHFAALAMQGYLSADTDFSCKYEHIANYSYNMADAMMLERRKNED